MSALAWLVLLLSLAGCSQAVPPTDSRPVILTSASRQADIPVQRGASQLLVEVSEVQNPATAPITIVVEDNGSPPMVDRFSLYPPDRPGRFSIRISPNATRIRVSLAPVHAEGESQVRVRIAATSMPR